MVRVLFSFLKFTENMRWLLHHEAELSHFALELVLANMPDGHVRDSYLISVICGVEVVLEMIEISCICLVMFIMFSDL
jgi:hypothetical protein